MKRELGGGWDPRTLHLGTLTVPCIPLGNANGGGGMGISTEETVALIEPINYSK